MADVIVGEPWWPICPKEHTWHDHWTEDTCGVEHRIVCDCDCKACEEY